MNSNFRQNVVALGLLDSATKKSFLFEAGPDIITQWNLLANVFENPISNPAGVFVSHAHIGHYSGLMYLGKEALNTKAMPVFAMPKMSDFLRDNGPWSQLISTQNIVINTLSPSLPLAVTENFKVVVFLVPHRDEFSETIGFKITGPTKSALFIPDIDKWEKWQESILDKIKEVDYAFLDGTFYDAAEVGYRDISEIPHPFVVESLSLFQSLSATDRKKIYFIHFNHTNPLLNPESRESKKVLGLGFQIAREGMLFEL
jgi:pyrroloquinoline quinone biosynthesis protein B